MADTKFEKGKEKTGGRKKGTQNKLTTDMKQFYFEILNHVKMNGLEGAVAVFSKNDRNKITFYQGGFKMLPSNVKMNGDLNVTNRLSMSELKKSLKEFKENGS